jgi:hypothetical protein
MPYACGKKARHHQPALPFLQYSAEYRSSSAQHCHAGSQMAPTTSATLEMACHNKKKAAGQSAPGIKSVQSDRHAAAHTQTCLPDRPPDETHCPLQETAVMPVSHHALHAPVSLPDDSIAAAGQELAESAWIDVIQRMDEVYSELVASQETLETNTANWPRPITSPRACWQP